jgi:tetratricopeptide (TPR) repeat protein
MLTGSLLTQAGFAHATQQVEAGDRAVSSPDGPRPTYPRSALERAARHYDLAVRRYADGDFRDALEAFEAAYRIVPDYRVLYNVAKVNLQLGRLAAALAAFERYLQEGRGALSAERIDEVQQRIAELRLKTAYLLVRVDVPGASILLDGTTIERSPLQRWVLVDSGEHRLTVKKPGYRTEERRLEISGGARHMQSIHLDFVESSRKPTSLPASRNVPSSRSIPWVGWAITGGLAAGWALAGGLALTRYQQWEAERRADTTRTKLDRAEARARSMAITADVLAGSTLAAGAISLYFTLGSPTKERVSWSVSPLGVTLGSQY